MFVLLLFLFWNQAPCQEIRSSNDFHPVVIIEEFIYQNETDFENIFIVPFPGHDDFYTQINLELINVTYDIEVKNNYSNVFSVAIPYLNCNHLCHGNCNGIVFNNGTYSFIMYNTRELRIKSFDKSHINIFVNVFYKNYTGEYADDLIPYVKNKLPTYAVVLIGIIGVMLLIIVAIVIGWMIKQIRCRTRGYYPLGVQNMIPLN